MAASTCATPRSSRQRWNEWRERIRRSSAELAFIPHVADMARSRTSTCAAIAQGGAERAVDEMKVASGQWPVVRKTPSFLITDHWPLTTTQEVPWPKQ